VTVVPRLDRRLIVGGALLLASAPLSAVVAQTPPNTAARDAFDRLKNMPLFGDRPVTFTVAGHARPP